jgi:hypothetical protein
MKLCAKSAGQLANTFRVCHLSNSPYQVGDECRIVRVGHVIIGIKALDKPMVCAPSHPFRFWRQLPILGIKLADQPRLDLCFSGLPAVVDRQKLRSIRDLPCPSLPATKFFRSGRHPEHRCSPMDGWANEVPLPAAKVSRARDQGDLLIRVLGLTAKPSCLGSHRLAVSLRSRSKLRYWSNWIR